RVGVHRGRRGFGRCHAGSSGGRAAELPREFATEIERRGRLSRPTGERGPCAGWGGTSVARAKKGAMLIETFPVGPLGCNCSLVIDPESGSSMVIDPGGDFEQIRGRLEKRGAKVTSIVHTHTHIDHVGATAPLQRWSNTPARI